MSAAAVAGAAARLTTASHAFAEAVTDRHATAIAAEIEPAFLAEVGWDPARWVLSPPSKHPLLGRLSAYDLTCRCAYNLTCRSVA